MLSAQKFRHLSRAFDELLILKREQFTGQLRLKSADDQAWTIYVQAGQMLYGTGGLHPVRRLQRRLFQFVPGLTRQE